MKLFRTELLVDLAWVVFAAVYCVIASTYPPGGRLVPLTVGAVALVAGLAQLSGNFIAFMRPFTHGDAEIEVEQASGDRDYSALKAILWAGALLAGLFLIGALAAVFLFFIAYFLANGRRWALGLISGTLMTGVTWALFGQLMSFKLPEGIITHLVLHLL